MKKTENNPTALNMKQSIINLILQKTGENKLVSFDKIVLRNKNNETLYLEGLGVINNRLVVFATKYSSNDYQLGNIFGVAGEKDDILSKDRSIGLPDIVLMKAYQQILNNENLHIEFDFDTMTSPDAYHTYLDELVEDANDSKNARKILDEFKKLKEGEITGYFEFYDDRIC